jgi:hypothetical protein
MFIAIIDSKQVEEQKISEILEISRHLENIKPEKENNISLANENVQFPINDVAVCRPIRKSKRLSRKLEDNLKSESHVNAKTNNIKSITSSDSSLKRRRGITRTSFTDCPADELQNLPKRPVRRRQAVVDHNIS